MAFTVFRCLTCAVVLRTAFASTAAPIMAERLPDPRIPGFHFPESEATLTGWITALSRGSAADAAPAAFERTHLHAWGVWTALTAETNQLLGGQKLRVFETWLTPDDLTGPPVACERTPLRQLAQLRVPAEAIERPEPPQAVDASGANPPPAARPCADRSFATISPPDDPGNSAVTISISHSTGLSADARPTDSPNGEE